MPARSIPSEVALGTAPPDAAPPVEEKVSPREISPVRWLMYLALLPALVIARVWLSTLRIRANAEDRARMADTHTPMVVIQWHNRLFITRELFRRFRSGRRMVALVSASRDGAWLTAFFRLTGWRTVRGSSSWRGMQATRELLAHMDAGRDAGITPDGPRGPCYDLKPGVLLLARRSKAPILLLSAHFHSAWRLRSWDGFYLPKPFSIVEMRTRMVPSYASLGAADSEGAAAELSRRLMEITTDA